MTWLELHDILTLQQVADYLQLSQNSVKKMFSSGELHAFKIGSVWRMDKMELLKIKYPAGKNDLLDDLRLAAELLMSVDRELAIRLSLHADKLRMSVDEKT